MKEKIWQSQFIDLALLSQESATTILARSDQAANLTFALEGGSLVLKRPGLQRKKIESFDEWQSAFHTYTAIFLLKHTNRFAELLKYAEIIRTASIQFPGNGWKLYDEQFRLKQEANPARSWGELDSELWLTVAAVGVNLPSTARAGQLVPRTGHTNCAGQCFAYNLFTGCHIPNCKYAHSCHKCLRPGHGASRCRMAGNARGINGSQAANSRQSRTFSLPPASAGSSRRNSPRNGTGAPLTHNGTMAAVDNKLSNFRPAHTN